MTKETFYDGDDDTVSDDTDELESGTLDDITLNSKIKKNYNLEARRKIEQLMELRRLREYSDDIEWQDLY